MDREQVMSYISQTYGADPEHPWEKYPGYTVFRHGNNKKWFALVMDVTGDKLGLPGREPIDVMNVKCDPRLMGSLRQEAGIYPAYHMSKASWLTVALDGSVSEEKLKWLLDMSYDLTAARPRAPRKSQK